AVLLLVGAVELDEVLVRVAEMVGPGCHHVGDGPAQLAARFLLHLDARALRFLFDGNLFVHCDNPTPKVAGEQTLHGPSVSAIRTEGDTVYLANHHFTCQLRKISNGYPHERNSRANPHELRPAVISPNLS